MSEVKLVWITPNAEEVIAYCARVSNPSNQTNPNYAKLLDYCFRNKHHSVFEMASACFEIKCSRTIARQILRHRSFSFQEFCISGDSLVTCLDNNGKSKKRAIKDLYTMQADPRMNAIWDRNIRVYDKNTKTFISSKIKEVFKTGIKKTYILTLEDGKTIQSTMKHKFFDIEGEFRSLETFKPDEYIAVNGEFTYQSKDWLAEAKIRNIANGKGVKGIADDAGCSYHTIRKWIKIHSLQFTPHEVRSYVEAWNKNLPAEMQPMFGKVHSSQTRQKQHKSSRTGKESNLYKMGKSGIAPERLKIWRWQHKYKNMLLKKFNNRCNYCGREECLEIDHIIPVSQNPGLSKDVSNLQILCKDCHRQKSTKESNLVKQTIKYKKIISIEYFGEEETYDLEVEHESHNYIANGIVVHNSGRYSVMPETPIISEARRQDLKNRQNSIDNFDQETKDDWRESQNKVWGLARATYDQAIASGIAKEVARNVLPEGMVESTMYMTGTIRSWIHYLQVRTGNGTQAEHIEVANQILGLLENEVPAIFGKDNWISLK